MWDWAGTAGGEGPDVILAAIGDVPTLEALAAAALLRERVPELRVRFVNVVDLMRVMPSDVHPHGLSEAGFEDIFGIESDEVVVAFHGYARALHQLLHGRRHPGRFHVRGFREQGTTTTPFDMTVLNGMSRYHLATQALAGAAAVSFRGSESASITATRCSSATATTSASTSRTSRRSATGPGPASAARPDRRRQRRLVLAQAAPSRRG